MTELTGSAKQIKWATEIRKSTVKRLWEEGFHGTREDWRKDCQKLPTDSVWWIEAKTERRALSSVMEILSLEYQVPAGADY